MPKSSASQSRSHSRSHSPITANTPSPSSPDLSPSISEASLLLQGSPQVGSLLPPLPVTLSSYSSASCVDLTPPSVRSELSDPAVVNYLHPIQGTSRLSDRQRRTDSRSSSSQPPGWTAELQRQLESDLARITASANIPFSWIDDPEFTGFFARWFPAAKPISRQVLTSRLIPAELDAQRVARLPQIRGSDATLQCDGWSGGNFRHYTGFTMTANNEVMQSL